MSEENKKQAKELTELLIVLKGQYALEVCAGIYSQNNPEQHPYIAFIKRYGQVNKITGLNLIHCAMQEQWIDPKYHLVEHIYKKGEKIQKDHENREDVVSALEELNKQPEIVREQNIEKITKQEPTTEVIVVNEEILQKVEEKSIQNEESSKRKLEQVL